MTKRKFTPPTEFPAEYVNGYGNEVVIYAKGQGQYPFMGQWKSHLDDDGYNSEVYSNEGVSPYGCFSLFNLYDKTKRIKQWINVYKTHSGCSHISRDGADEESVRDRICVYRLEYNEDGSNPEIFVEDV